MLNLRGFKNLAGLVLNNFVNALILKKAIFKYIKKAFQTPQ
jgi:hypothetical protein